jgi:histone H3/H4
MRSHSDGYRVSPSAVKELVGRIDSWFEMNMKGLCDVAKSHGRKTVMEDDITEFFGFQRNGFLEVG